MIPVGDAFDKTGTTKLIADGLVSLSGDLQPIWILALLLLVTMLLTDIVNNAATALLMAPLGIDIAQRLKANPDTFLMIVAVGASCAFLTDRKSVVSGKSVSVRVDLGGRRIIKKNKQKKYK